jgi:hypothetical protein
MSYTAKVLVQQQFVENASTKKYTSPLAAIGGKGTWIDKATFANISGSSATVTVYLVPAGGATGDATKTIPPVSIAAGATLSITDLAGKFMGPGDELWWLAGTASAINGAVNGREVT